MEGYTYLGMVELGKIKDNKMKEKTITEYKRRFRLMKWENKITAINAWAVAKLKTGEKKKIYGHFIREMPDKTDWDKTLQWLSKNDLI